MGILNAGDLDRLLGLYHVGYTQNPANGEKVASRAAQPYTTVNAKKADLKGTKRLIGQQNTAQQQTEFTVRWSPSLSAGISVSDQAIETSTLAVYEILDVAEVGHREGLCLLCRTVTK